MIGGFTKVEEAREGPRKSKELINNHGTCLRELQREIQAMQLGGGLNGEDTEFLGIKDAKLVRYIIKAVLIDVIDPDAAP